ncbi:MAG: rRNA maturation RNase YbeY [Erysipelotrichaceae bacterium]|nr:rRNA maturation RNase YbeY [Erysipelotrichaceae bacterium]
MELNVYNRTRVAGYAVYRTVFSEIFEKTISNLKLNPESSVSVIFVRDKKMHEINREYRGIDRTTDVISFAMADNQDENDYFETELGDIFINIDAAERQAVEYEHSVRREICFLFTHGLLHLCGYDHMNPDDEKKMIAKQKEILDDIVPQNEK